VAYAALLWASREVEIGFALAGQLACEALNFALKRLIREERPAPMDGRGYGMPSSHAQFVAFFAAYAALFLLRRHRPRQGLGMKATLARGTGRAAALASWVPGPFAQQVLVALVCFANAAVVAASRVYLSYHTPRQVLAGCAAGSLFAVLWFVGTSEVRRRGWIRWALEFEVARALRIRDLLLEEDLVESGWRAFEVRRMEQRQKQVQVQGGKKKR